MKKNLVLIGMPGSGKTTVGRLLSEHLNVPFADLDEEIEKYAKQTIPELFERGEAHFRDIESKVTAVISQKTPLVIASGGGIVLREENISVLRINGLIIFLDRNLNKIAGEVDTDTRPLLKEDTAKLQKLYDERIDLYEKYADLIIENDESPELAVKQIIEHLAIGSEKGE